jgi:hypothetical protein
VRRNAFQIAGFVAAIVDGLSNYERQALSLTAVPFKVVLAVKIYFYGCL